VTEVTEEAGKAGAREATARSSRQYEPRWRFWVFPGLVADDDGISSDDALDRSERVIAVGRLVLSFAALAIITVDPRKPMYSISMLYTVLVAYIAYSAVLFWVFSTRRVRLAATSKPILVADVGWFTLIVILSEGSTSPFFLLYLFGVCTAAMRWGVRTTVRVAAWSGAVYLVSILVVRRALLGPDFQIHTAHLMRPIYLVVLGYLVGFIGEHELSAKRRLLEMISVQREVGRSRSQLFTVVRLLHHVISFFGADYLLVQVRAAGGERLEWEGSRSPERRMRLRDISPGSWTAAAAGPDCYRVVHTLGNWGRRVECYEVGASRARGLTESEEPAFFARSSVRSLISVPIYSSGGVDGRLLVGRRRSNFSKEDLGFCQTLVAQAAVILENVILQEKAEELAVAEERGRIARDVHDGFVQSLASIDVGIEVCRRLEVKNPAALDEELLALQQTVKHGYREARSYLDRLRHGASTGPDVDEAALVLVSEFRERTDLDIVFSSSAAGIPARHGVGFELLQIVREGLTNIYRHAHASRATVSVTAHDTAIEVCIRDDGRGFPSAHANGGARLPNSAVPWSIRERVEALGGDLSLSSRAGSGSEMRIMLPSGTS
jgi:signal transduction histidine kinase